MVVGIPWAVSHSRCTARGSSALQLQAGQARQTLRRETGQRVVLTFDEVVE